jgi:hypothetical protein
MDGDLTVWLLLTLVAAGGCIFFWGIMGAVVGGPFPPKRASRPSVPRARGCYLLCALVGAGLVWLARYCIASFDPWP